MSDEKSCTLDNEFIAAFNPSLICYFPKDAADEAAFRLAQVLEALEDYLYNIRDISRIRAAKECGDTSTYDAWHFEHVDGIEQTVIDSKAELIDQVIAAYIAYRRACHKYTC